VEVIACVIQPTGDAGIIGVWHSGEGGMDAEPYDAEFAGKRIKNLNDAALLREILRRVANPWDGYFMWLRCLTTCRSVFFGYDGQAWLCLRLEDTAPSVSWPIQVQECTEGLSEMDCFDG
jgi:hypothetical protein